MAASKPLKQVVGQLLLIVCRKERRVVQDPLVLVPSNRVRLCRLHVVQIGARREPEVLLSECRVGGTQIIGIGRDLSGWMQLLLATDEDVVRARARRRRLPL